MLRKRNEMPMDTFTECHGGVGDLVCRTVLSSLDSEIGIQFMHDDTMQPGVTIGEHLHHGNEEVYFVVEGNGTLIYDSQRFPIGAGDVSVVRNGHSHGLENTGETALRLLVFCVKPPDVRPTRGGDE